MLLQAELLTCALRNAVEHNQPCLLTLSTFDRFSTQTNHQGLTVCRFNPLDVRCGIQLDEIDPAQWALLEAATDDYILSIDGRFQEAAEVLLSGAPAEAALPALPFRAPSENLLQLRVLGVSQ